MPACLDAGPRPGCMKNATDEDIARLCLTNPKLRILTWDEYAPALDARIKAAVRKLQPADENAGKGIMVFGIRDIKGMEFAEVAIIDFFAASKPADDAVTAAAGGGAGVENNSGLRVTGAWQALTVNDHHAWKWLLLKAGDEVKMIPQELNVQLKILYTAITRSASRLVFIESSTTKGGDAWFRYLISKELAKQVR